MSTWIEFVLVPDLTHKGKITVFALTLQLPTSDYYLFSPLLLHISLSISYENLVLDQDDNFYLISLSIPITCLLDDKDIVGRSYMLITFGG